MMPLLTFGTQRERCEQRSKQTDLVHTSHLLILNSWDLWRPWRSWTSAKTADIKAEFNWTSMYFQWRLRLNHDSFWNVHRLIHIRGDTFTGDLASDRRPAEVAGGGRERQRNFTGNLIRDQMEVRRVSLPPSLSWSARTAPQNGNSIRPYQVSSLSADPRTTLVISLRNSVAHIPLTLTTSTRLGWLLPFFWRHRNQNWHQCHVMSRPQSQN